jgi:hypothetical protein
VWLDRNLGATQVATKVDDSAAYGDYYQWGRAKDGIFKKLDAASLIFLIFPVSAFRSASVGTLKPAGQMSFLSPSFQAFKHK